MGSTGVTAPAAGGAGTLIRASYTLLGTIETSVCTRGAAGTVVAPAGATPGMMLPSSAIKVNPATVAAAPAPLNPWVSELTIEGTWKRRPAFTTRTSTVPLIPVKTGEVTPVVVFVVVPAVAGKTETPGAVLLNATPLMR